MTLAAVAPGLACEKDGDDSGPFVHHALCSVIPRVRKDPVTSFYDRIVCSPQIMNPR